MTQYLKHYYVSYLTPTYVLTDSNSIPGGKTHPAVVGLDVQIQLPDSNGIDYCLSLAPSDSDTQVAGVTTLTETEWKSEWETAFEMIKQNRIKIVYEEYKTKFAALPDSYYHPYEMLYGSYIKRVEAAAIQEGMTLDQAKLVAPTIAVEAELRGTDIFVLAGKILAHARQFDDAQARLLAERGASVDRIAAVVCDNTSLDTIRSSINTLYTVY